MPVNQLCRQLKAPGRSTLCFFDLEFHDQGPTLKLHDEKPFWVKLNFTGPSDQRLRNLIPMVLRVLLESGQSVPNRASPANQNNAPSLTMRLLPDQGAIR